MTKRLGRGLDALIPALELKEDDKVIEIGLSNLRPNPYQPRKNFLEDKIDELALSIKEHGVIQPIIVRQVLRGYEIIAGERRWRASKKCGLKTIPAVVRSFTDQQVTEIALIENLQREDLNPMEVAVAYQSLMDQFEITQEELSVKVGKSRSHIANFLRLLQLPNEIKQYVSRGTLSMGHARAIVGLKDNDLKKEMTNLTIKNEWSVRELEKAIQNTQETKSKKKKTKTNNPFITQLEGQLREKYKTSVKIKNNQNDKGIIELSYYSKDDLQRLLDLL
ncbi:ParB/RepB/Spo0J family partition protein [Chengkuizengella sp. SCS-71B]|uniref:ParB/RepB/Spo0J family partition protein n=1 Tax=Chengkuizengella sp. SCS-71B TaxID=3115290 RepID=UPI0032C2403C